MNKDICLCIVFNHPYPENIDLLDKIYGERFPTIRYLVPFYRDESNPNVIPVYRGSYVHQGFANDAAWKLRQIDCSHFVFLQDDVLLNPNLNANNLLEKLGVGPEDSFINQISNMEFDVGSWHWILGILWKFFYPRNQLSGTGVDSVDTIIKYLPPVDYALEKLGRYGVQLPKIYLTENSLQADSVISGIPYFSTQDKDLIFQMNKVVVDSLYSTAPSGNCIEIPYPFAVSAWGADFFVVPKSCFEEYQHYSGVLAAAGTFAEISVATALALASPNVVTAKDKDLLFEWVWSPDREHQSEALSQKLQDEAMVAVHPVKLSLFRKDTESFARVFPDLSN